MQIEKTNSRRQRVRSREVESVAGKTDAAPHSPDIIATARYISEMSAELAGLAGRSQLPMLAYFLNLARVEAEERTRAAIGVEIGNEVERPPNG
jgi:hypothetical protein